MKIHEYQARELLAQAGIPIPAGRVVTDEREAAAVFSGFSQASLVAKVQVLMGGRGKAGGVRIVRSASEARDFARHFLGKPFSTAQSGGESAVVRSILFTEDRAILEEYYLGLVVDRSLRKPVLLISREGGVDIEEVAAQNPQAILKIPIEADIEPDARPLDRALSKLFAEPAVRNQAVSIAMKLTRLFIEKDLAVCEINPLALCRPDEVLALDAKIVFDDNALFRHPDIAALKDPAEEDERERRAKAAGLSYISMQGNVGCLVNGAGLAMATMDMIKLAGGEPANFLDVGGGATADQVREGFKIILQDDRVSAILVNIFGGIMQCDVIAQGVLEASREIRLKVPLVVRLEGTRVEEGRALLKNSGLEIHAAATIRDAAEAAVRLARRHSKNHVHSR
jgi:succinyl-CoA synthetase beta subunit